MKLSAFLLISCNVLLNSLENKKEIYSFLSLLEWKQEGVEFLAVAKQNCSDLIFITCLITL